MFKEGLFKKLCELRSEESKVTNHSRYLGRVFQKEKIVGVTTLRQKVKTSKSPVCLENGKQKKINI